MTIRALIEAVERGDELPRPLPFPCSTSALVLGAFHGSLDAALALHEALLPGWWQEQRISTRTRVRVGNVDAMPWCYNEIAARAWLLAILAAITEERK